MGENDVTLVTVRWWSRAGPGCITRRAGFSCEASSERLNLVSFRLLDDCVPATSSIWPWPTDSIQSFKAR